MPPNVVRIARSTLSGHLEVDGSLRDLYVLDADIDIWQRTVDGIVASEYEWEYRIDGRRAALPSIADVMSTGLDAIVFLQITAGRAAVNCHFFDDREVEFDVSPSDLADQSSLDDVLDFMSLVAAASGRSVRMTHENSPEALICEVRSAASVADGYPSWFVWPDRIDLRPEFGSEPVWSKSEPFYLDPYHLPIDRDLADDLLAWQREWWVDVHYGGEA